METVISFRIWERYFFKEFFKTLFFILASVFFLFAVIDFSSHASMHRQHGMTFKAAELLYYYFFEFSLQLKVLLPFSALVSTIKVVSDLSLKGELTALLTSGLKLKRLLRPFFIAGLFLTFASLGNEQFITPGATRYIDRMIEMKKREGKKRKKEGQIHSIILDGPEERLLYTGYESEALRFFDVVWMRSFDEIYKMKYLYPFELPPKAEGVEIIKRESDGKFSLFKTYKSLSIQELHLQEEMLTQTIMKPDEFSLSDLIKKAPFLLTCESEKECQILTSLLQKILLPWFCLFAVIAPLPSAIFFSRGKLLYPVYLGLLFAFFFCYLFVEAASVLAKKQVYQPELALGLPFLCLLVIIFYRYSKL